MSILNICLGMICLIGYCNPDRMKIEGEVTGIKGDKIYLGRITNEYYGLFDVVDSAAIKNGKFIFIRDSVIPEVMFLGTGRNEGGVFFAEAGTIKVKSGNIKEGKVDWKVSGSALDAKYRSFLQQNDSVRNQKRLDSLTELFYAARGKDNRAEMARIKEESIINIDKANQAEYELVKEWVARNRDNELGIYLYYSKLFGRMDFFSLEGIEKEREYISGFGQKALFSVYKSKLDKQLDLYAGCAIGAIAPEIMGRDTLGNPIKLSDFRGKYVLVDFWNSYCHWCREETPWLRKAIEAFKDKDFTILGVSDDRKEELWLKAIKEDGSHWNHLLLEPGKSMTKTYCIKGIPHIILIGPDGKILAKDIRHEELTEVPAKFIR